MRRRRSIEIEIEIEREEPYENPRGRVAHSSGELFTHLNIKMLEEAAKKARFLRKRIAEAKEMIRNLEAHQEPIRADVNEELELLLAAARQHAVDYEIFPRGDAAQPNANVDPLPNQLHVDEAPILEDQQVEEVDENPLNLDDGAMMIGVVGGGTMVLTSTCSRMSTKNSRRTKRELRQARGSITEAITSMEGALHGNNEDTIKRVTAQANQLLHSNELTITEDLDFSGLKLLKVHLDPTKKVVKFHGIKL
ncbi:hypothetical protein HA466_0162760 [Hirschfeldia incana]|nr:hypothetical protein HA466_0162760 [Hirschfeldia incana]